MNENIYKNVNAIEWIREVGPTLALAGKMIGARTKEAGMAVAAICFTENISILDFQRRYHILDDGMLSMKADYMRTRLRELGGDYAWEKDGTDGEAAMLLTYREKTHRVSYSMADAQKEGLVRKGSRWEKKADDMLRARCSTRGMRMHASEVLNGMMTDEEAAAIEVDDSQPQLSTTANKAGGSTTGTLAAIANASPSAGGAAETAQPISSQPNAPPASSSTAEPRSQQPGDPCSEYQRGEIERAWNALNVPVEHRAAQLQKRGASVLRNLTVAQGAELLEKLQTVMQQQAAALTGESRAEPAAASSSIYSPCTGEQVAEAKRLLAAAGDPYLPGKLKLHLVKYGAYTIADLSQRDAARLITSLQTKQVEDFFSGELLRKPEEQPPFTADPSLPSGVK